jgi:FtsH-binding integral membrane protein
MANNPYLSNPYESPNPYAFGNAAAFAAENERTTFLRKTYLHLLGAVLAFIGLEVVLFKSGLGESLVQTMFTGRWSWLIVMGAFLVVSWLANKWAYSDTSRGIQYAGLALYTAAEAVIFLPILWIVQNMYPNGNEMLATAALITTALFGGLTATIMLTKADMNWMRKYLTFGSIALLIVILVAGFTGAGTLGSGGLALWIPVGGALLMCGYILYETSAMMHHMRTDQYVAASLALFSSLATLFYYVLRIVMELQSRD